jgi:DNA-binding beta-propeller fold protein YncE
MKVARYYLLLFLTACASGPHTVGVAVPINGKLVTAKMLRSFYDATAMSADQFLNVYVVESSANVVIKLSPKGDSLHAIRGFGSDHYQFNGPSGIDARITNAVFISDRFNHRIEQYNKDLTYSGTLYTRENIDPTTGFGYPAAVAADEAGNIYVADGENKRVVKFRSDYTFDRVIGGYSDAMRPDAILSNPIGLAIGRDQHLVVLDNGGTSLVEFDNLGNVLERTQLSNEARAISASNDTIFVLMSQEPQIRLFLGTGLVELGGWRLVRTNDADPSPAQDLCVRNGTVYFLTREALYACHLERLDMLSH